MGAWGRGESGRSARGPRGQVVWPLVGILTLALALRILYLIQAREHLFFNQLADSSYYHLWAQHIARGDPGPPVFFMGPLYPHLLAVFYRFLGPRPEAILWFQALLSSLGCGLIYALGRRTFDRTVGLLAALIGALYVVEIFYVGALLMTTLVYVLNLLLLVALLWARDRRGSAAWIVPGLLLGLSAIGRSSVLAFLPLILAGIFLPWRPKGRRRSRIVSAVAVIAGVAVILIPVTLHNALVGKDAVLITSNFGLNFYVGNNPDAEGFYDEPKGMAPTTDRTGSQVAMYFSKRRLKPSQVSQFWFRRAWSYIAEQPRSFLKLLVKKFLFFWNAYEIPQAEHLDFSKRFVPLLRWPLVSFSLLGPLGLLGIVLGVRRWRETYFPLAFLLATMTATVPFFVISRLRIQICSVLMIFAAYALVWFWRSIRARRFRLLVLALAGLAALFAAVNWPYAALRPARDMARSHNFLALSLWTQSGDREGAVRECQQARALDPEFGETYLCLANLCAAAEEYEEMEALWHQALRVDPRATWAHFNLGNLYADQGLWDEAIREYQLEITSSPYNLEARKALLIAQGERERSRAEPAPLE